MDTVYVLRHEYEKGDDWEEKFIGVYRDRGRAEAAIDRLKSKPGFRDHPDGFVVGKVQLDRDGWTEGFISWAEALKDD